jgi:hypothetical protein
MRGSIELLEVAAPRAERAHVVLALELARRLGLLTPATETAVIVAADQLRFSLLAICKVRTNP